MYAESPFKRLAPIFGMSGNAYFLLLRFNCRLRLITVAICALSEHYNNAYEREFLTRLRPSTMSDFLEMMFEVTLY